MAANEHKNLNDINRHNPKGFETATNNTVLSKTAGTSATGTDGNLQWQDKSFMGATNYKMQGYITTALTNYSYGQDLLDNKSPYLINIDSGGTTLGSITIAPNAFFEMGQAQIVPENCSAVSFKGWATSTGSNEFTIAICKLTPVADNTSNRTAERVKEIELTGLSSNNKLIAIDETTFAVASDADISAGDIIFPMIKETTGGSEIYINLTIKTTTY